MSTPCLYSLPVEVLHRIIDYVDPETIFLSFRSVCKYFYTIINTYNQYKLDFRSITKPAFHHVCHFIQPENVISLIVSDEYKTPGQTKLFLSLFDINKFTRLRSMNLIRTDSSDLIIYLKHLNTCPLASLSIDHGRYLSSIPTAEIQQLFIQCSIRHLAFTQSRILQELLHIFLSSPFLETLILDGHLVSDNDGKLSISMAEKSKLKSLTMNFYSSNMNIIRSILSFAQSLTYLKLIGQPTACALTWDGYWWADFIKNNLPKLKFFEFFFDKKIDYKESTCAIESIMNSFRTSFWLEKKWYVACDYYKDTRELKLYSIPICKSTILYKSTSNKISCSNITNEMPYIMDNVSSLIINFIPTTPGTYDSNILPNRPLFWRVTKLKLLITNDFSNDSINYLSSLIDFSHLDTLLLTLDLSDQSFKNITSVMNNLFDQTYNIQTIDISSTRSKNLVHYLEIIFPIMPNQVKHLIVEIDTVSGIDWISPRLKKFSSISLKSKNDYQSKYDGIIEEFVKQGRDLTYYKSFIHLNIWFGEQK